MYANVLNEYGALDWQRVHDPGLSPDQVMIKVGYASICGSDQHIFHGQFHPRTRLPLIPGHEFAGEIVEVGKEVSGHRVGERVAVDPIMWCGACPACEIGHFPACTSLKLLGVDLDGGFGQFVAARPHMLYTLPDAVSDRHGALVEVLGIGFHACNRAGVQQGDTVAIWGAGKVGQCVLQAVKTRTEKPVILIDVLQERLDRASRAYPDVRTVHALHTDPVEVVREYTQGKGVDVAIEVVGHDTTEGIVVNPVRGCVQIIRGAGRVCVLGLGDDPAPVVFKELIWKEGTIVSSRVTHGEFRQVIDAMVNNQLKPDALITEVLPAEQAMQGFEMLDNAPEKHLKILLEF
jgi:threonine dehydrogenase-like Zn-dependent dehydrogenase